MTDEQQSREERVGGNYDTDQMLEARRRTWDAVGLIASRIEPGMAEEEARALARRTLKELGLLRGWHGIYIRFGRNTLCYYGAESEPNVVLGENDIFFIDIGPVWQKWEGDAGDTFVVGNDPEMHAAKRDARLLYDVVAERWRQERLTGRALYDFADAEARKLGWRLHLDVGGHRLSDFPHGIFHQGELREAGYTPSSGLWVLEIQLRHPERPFGAFHEDLLF